MEALRAQHKKWTANFFCGKLKELHFYLTQVVEGCDRSLADFSLSRPHSKDAVNAVVYGFSSLSNCIQTLKDSSSAILAPQVTWGDVKKCRHGKFFYLSRNAATHDGNPVVSAWVDGRFYVPLAIKRFDNHGRPVVIPVPEVDVRTFCLEFCFDFSSQLKSRISDGVDVDSDILGSVFEVDEIKEFMGSDRVPQFVRNLLDQNLASIEASLKESKFNPADQAVSVLDGIIEYCAEKLA